MTSKFLITGGSGFIGQYLVNHLVSFNYDVIATTTHLNGKNNNKNLRWVVWDTKKRETIDIDWGQVDAIIHAAAPRYLLDFPNNEHALYDVFIEGTMYLLNQCVKHNITNFNLISTGDALGHADAQDEMTHFYCPHSFYGATKASAELLVKAYSNKLTTKIIRLFHPYGIGGERFLIQKIIRRIYNNETISIEGSNGIHLNPIWIDDMINGMQKCIQYNYSDVFHLGGKEVFSLKEIIHVIASQLHINPHIHHLDKAVPFSHVGNIDYTCEQLNWEPLITLSSGVNKYMMEFEQ